MNIKVIIALLASLILFACSPDSGSSSEPSGNEVENKIIASDGGSTTVSYTETVNLSIAGSNNQVTVSSELKELSVAGSNNLITVSDEVTIGSIRLIGNDNTVSLPNGYSTDVNDFGIGNTVTNR